MPAVGLVALEHVLGEGDVGVALDADVVVVVDDDQVAQPLMAAQAAGLGGDSLLKAAVAGDDVDPVIEEALSRIGRLVEGAAHEAGVHGHPDGRGEALSERAGGGFHPDRGRTPGARASGCPRFEKDSQIRQRQPVAAKVELDVQGEARMAVDSTNRSRPIQWGSVGSLRMCRWNSR